ncbi:hypothetical protein [Halobellus rubicundus]|uniref:Sulfatase N-terminal domain-containing protein n=1 Tax=Halobellus rubicundus TaxID=2996466 RepID=A0ABD5MA70_9EURY
MFEELNTISGDLQAVYSMGSTTGEFLTKNFSTGTYPGTVYISANPHIQTHNIGQRFHASVRLWEEEWDEKLRTVPPKRVVQRAKNIEKIYPNKRLIIHFIQPHYPFIGKTGQKIRHSSMTGNGIIKNERSYSSIWDRLESNEISQDQVRKAYRENLQLTLPHVQNLSKSLKGKTVVTSDHGNALGEWGIYGHPGSTYIPPLVKVPWLVITDAVRKEIVEETMSDGHKQTSSKKTEERLEALGYKR